MAHKHRVAEADEQVDQVDQEQDAAPTQEQPQALTPRQQALNDLLTQGVDYFKQDAMAARAGCKEDDMKALAAYAIKEYGDFKLVVGKHPGVMAIVNTLERATTLEVGMRHLMSDMKKARTGEDDLFDAAGTMLGSLGMSCVLAGVQIGMQMERIQQEQEAQLIDRVGRALGNLDQRVPREHDPNASAL